MLDFTRVIAWFQEYPAWLQSSFFIWLVLTAILAGLFFVTPRNAITLDSERASPEERKKEPQLPNEPATIEQRTEGDNSPAVQGVQGDVNIKIDNSFKRKAEK